MEKRDEEKENEEKPNKKRKGAALSSVSFEKKKRNNMERRPHPSTRFNSNLKLETRDEV